LRSEGFVGRITLFGEEPLLPYDRPPLSKEFLKGEWPADHLCYRSFSAYEQQGIDLRLNTRVEGLNTETQLVFVANDEPLHYDHLLLAVGGYPKRLSIAGAELAGIHYLRTLKDSAALNKELQPGAKLVVVGGGFIGCEVAAAARALGVEVTVLEAFALPMAQAFGPEIGEFYLAEHRAKGVDFRLNEAAVEFVGTDKIESVVSSSGHTYACTVAVVGVGIRPATELLKSTTIAVDGGILVDEYCRTNVANVYAVGDAANWWHPLLKRRIRVEHWDNAAKQASVAARNMLGKNEIHCPVPYFWTDQYDLRLQLYGYIPKDKQVEFVVRGSYQERSFSVFYHVERRLVAVASINRLKDARAAVKLIESGVEIEPSQLADASVDIRQLVKNLAESEGMRDM
jgi:3-phenylpropionate/trans-cinnamate dioxygenase ferredoxin reductase subunit